MIRLAISVDREHAEIVLAELLELAPGGVEEVELSAGRVQYAVYGSPGELPHLPDLHAAAGGVVIEVSSSEVPDDWHERWKQFHRPIVIGCSPHPQMSVPVLRVRPPWEPARAQEGTIEIVIDPGQAFGTGAHATTKLCLELILTMAAGKSSKGALLDVGSGSGVLAIAAAKLGYEPVIALDHDPESLRAGAQNADVNGVSLDVRRLDIRTETIPWPEWPDRASDGQITIVANLLRPLLLDLSRRLPAPPAHLIAGGLLADEVQEIVSVYEKQWSMAERERRRDGDWAAVWLQGESGNSVAARTIAR